MSTLGAVLVACAVVAAGCFQYRGPAAPGGVSGGGGGSNGSSGVVGTWSRTIVLQSDTNNFTTSQTTWTFTTGGACERTVVTNSVQLGYPDAVTTTCTYTLAAGSVTIMLAGATQPVTFTVQVQGDTLTLGGEPFLRVT